MDKEKRLEKEKEFTPTNIQPMCVCCGEFRTSKKKEPEICKHRDKCFKYQRMKQHKKNVGEVKFHYVDTFRECDLWDDVVDSETIIHNAIYNILYCNDIALAELSNLAGRYFIDIKNNILEDKHDKETIKMFKAMWKRKEKYETMIKDIVNSKAYFLANYANAMDAFTEDEVERWKEAVRNVFRKNVAENAEYFADLEIARTIVGYSTCSATKRIRECMKYEKESISLCQYTLHYSHPYNREIDWNILKIIENLTQWAERNIKMKNGFDLNNEKEVMEAYRDMDRVLTDRFHISQALFTAEYLWK